MTNVLMERLSRPNEHAATEGVADPPATALGRSLGALEAFGEQDEWGVRELGRRLDLSPSTAYHIVSGLERLGLLQRTEGRRYCLGWRAGTLGAALSHGFRPAELSREVLARLAERTGETAHLGTRQRGEVVYLAKIEGHHAVRLQSQVGQRFPAHATACGKALLAYDSDAAEALVARGLVALTPHTITDTAALRAQLTAIRAGALARDVEEIELHAACAAVPVLPGDGSPVRFALSVSGPRERIEATLPVIEASLTEAAATLADRLYGGGATRPQAA